MDHCRNGHPYDRDNTGVARRHGVETRYCKACARNVARRRRGYNVPQDAPKVPGRQRVLASTAAHRSSRVLAPTPTAQALWDEYVAQVGGRMRPTCKFGHPRIRELVTLQRRLTRKGTPYISVGCRLCRCYAELQRRGSHDDILALVTPAPSTDPKEVERHRIAEALARYQA